MLVMIIGIGRSLSDLSRKVKCKVCGKELNINEAFKYVHFTSGGNAQNRYYCSEEEFNAAQKELEYHHMLDDEMKKYFVGIVRLPALYGMEFTAIAKAYSWEEMWNYFVDDRENIDRAMTKEFRSEGARIKYLAAIFRNNIGKKSYKRGEPIKKETNYDDFVAPVYKEPKKKTAGRVAFDDLI